MDDRLYYRELACYGNPDEPITESLRKKAYYDLSLLGSEVMRNEFRQYIIYRGSHATINSVKQDKSCFNQICRAFGTRRKLPESLLDWNEEKWVQILKGWMLKNGMALTEKKISVYGTTHILEAKAIRYLRKVIQFLQPEDTRIEQERDIWRMDKLGIAIEENPIYKTETLNFTGIQQDGIREEVKQAVYAHLKYEKIGTIQRELTAMRQFSRYLKEKGIKAGSCRDVDRALIEEYLIHKATSGSSGRGNSDEIIKLRSVLESVGKIYGYPHLERLFINTDIPPEIQPEFRTYSDRELKRLNAHITKLDEQITRCMVIHQMLGTRISDTLTLRQDCLFNLNGQDMIRIAQVKTSTFQKPVSAELAALIRRAAAYTREQHGDTEYIFVDEKDTSRPLQYTTLKYKILRLIQKEDLRDDEGKPFGFNTHMYRRSYGAKLTELHLDDWTIAKLLGHKGVGAVQHYRRMSNQILADETRRAREEQTRILLANLDGWEEEYEQIRQND